MGEIAAGEEKRLDQWSGLRKRVKEVLREVKEKRKVGKEGDRKRGWWDEECWREKREVRRKFKKWWKNEQGEEEYKVGKREYRNLCERKRKEEN